MPKGDQGDIKRAEEQTYERFRKHGGSDPDFSKAQAERARDRLERKLDQGKGPGQAKDSSK
jgi:hypothetical protein